MQLNTLARVPSPAHLLSIAHLLDVIKHAVERGHQPPQRRGETQLRVQIPQGEQAAEGVQGRQPNHHVGLFRLNSEQ